MDRISKDISLLIPAYNEEANIDLLFEKIGEFARISQYTIEAVIVDDGSTDRTREKIMECMTKYDFIISAYHRINLGMTAALITAFQNSSGKYLIVFPADLQYMPECIIELVKPLEQGYDLVTGWKEGEYEKRIVSSVYNKLSQLLFHNVNVHDLNSIKSMKREVLHNIQMRKDWHRYLVVLAAEMGYRVKEVRVKLYPRMHGVSKFSGRKRIIIGIFDMLSVKYLLSFSRKPLLLFGVVGLCLILLGILIGLYEIIARYVFHAGFRPILYLIMLLIMVGVNLFALGFIAELVVIVNEKIDNFDKKYQNLIPRRDQDD